MDEIIIDTEEVANFYYQKLVEFGFAPNEDEIEAIADITFDYLIALGIIDEIEED